MNGRAHPRLACIRPFDQQRFADFLHDWKTSERLTFRQIAERSGIALGVLHRLTNTRPSAQMVKRGQTHYSPNIETVASVAAALGLDFSYVAEQAGFGEPGSHDRWRNFSTPEREQLAQLLDCAVDDLDHALKQRVTPVVLVTTREAV